ncbi:MAG: hypothetical protein K6C05_10600 [Anaerovibrio sp.]|uniref:hypothetical protein n=1 Tax=Anaerovibrio sp. TaxID=1872532 RepID=UPI0025E78D8F|nr:hypothetical protein [Anaerovibrio sp.]MCR5177279.1 hypothetical protein [Anaerovibrio sp.]
MTDKDTLELEHQLSIAEEIGSILRDDCNDIPDMTISEYITLLMERHQLNKTDVIAASNLDRHYAYHILSGEKKQPSRQKIIALALAMKLSHRETQQLLYYAKVNQLYVKNTWDKVIWYALEKKLSVQETNRILNDFSLSPLLQ